MVAYSFKRRFAEPILLGRKAQTIRAERKRHARPGEQVQLYTGMRTKQCRKLGEAACLEVVPVRLVLSRASAAELFEVGGAILSPSRMDAFAREDGFASVEDMARFWWSEHAPGDAPELAFEGVLIRWRPLAQADPLDIGAVM